MTRCAWAEYAWFDGNSDGKTHPVGQKRPNAWGLFDMHGNVAEWCWDRGEGPGDKNYYANSPRADPPGPLRGAGRIFRGPGGPKADPRGCRSAVRDGDPPDVRGPGFRVARSTKAPGSERFREPLVRPRGTWIHHPNPPRNPPDRPPSPPDRRVTCSPPGIPARSGVGVYEHRTRPKVGQS